MKKHETQAQPRPATWIAVAVLALVGAACGGGGGAAVEPDAADTGAAQDQNGDAIVDPDGAEARSNWDDLIWDEDDWS